MNSTPKPTTIIARGAGAPYREWHASSGEQRTIVVDGFASACETLNHIADRELRHVILDHCTTAEGFLTLLSNLPAEFLGDVLFVGEEDHGFLSSCEPRGGRISYAIGPDDLQFYLTTQSLLVPDTQGFVKPIRSGSAIHAVPPLPKEDIVLVVDDDEHVRLAVSMSLQGPGRTILTCSDIESAQLMVESQPITAIVTDIRLTGPFAFEGLDFISHAARHRPECRIVLMTGNGSEELRREAKARGASAFLLKPFTITELEEVLELPTHSEGESRLLAIPTLDQILADHATYTVFHPIMRVSSVGLGVYGYECLTRVVTDTPLRNPELFFRYADRQKKLYETERQCIDNAFAASGALPPDALLFVNVHPQTLCRSEFAETFTRIAKQYAVDPARVVLEITEQSPIEDSASCLRNINKLRAAGVRFALDDVGVAYSHLLLIHEIRPSFLKISQDFGTDFERHENKQKIVSSIIALALSFGCELILEGVETEGTAAAAITLGIPLLQGYLYGRPATAESLFAAIA